MKCIYTYIIILGQVLLQDLVGQNKSSCRSTTGTAVERRRRAVFQEGCGSQKDGDHALLTGGKLWLGRAAGDLASSEASCEVSCFAVGFSRIQRLGKCCKLPPTEGAFPSRERRNHFSDFSWWCYPVRYSCISASLRRVRTVTVMP